MHYSALNRIERGHQRPLATDIEKCAKALGLTMAEFYGDILPPAPREDAGDVARDTDDEPDRKAAGAE